MIMLFMVFYEKRQNISYNFLSDASLSNTYCLIPKINSIELGTKEVIEKLYINKATRLCKKIFSKIYLD